MRPKGAEAEHLQALIQKLANQHSSPVFKPHVTLVGNIYSTDADIGTQKRKVEELASEVGKFTISMTGYGFMDEEYRCLYLLASSPRLSKVFERASIQFPQVNDEHFSKMPHLSLLYGHYSVDEKREIIASNPLLPVTFEIGSLDLFATSGSANDWHEIFSVELSPSN